MNQDQTVTKINYMHFPKTVKAKFIILKIIFFMALFLIQMFGICFKS